MTKPSYEELRIAKHSASPQIADSASGGKSTRTAKETRLTGGSMKDKAVLVGGIATVATFLLWPFATTNGGLKWCIPFFSTSIVWFVLRVFTCQRRQLLWTSLQLVGLCCNSAVVLANGGHMPVMNSYYQYAHGIWVPLNATQRLIFLADINHHASVGDLFLFSALPIWLGQWAVGRAKGWIGKRRARRVREIGCRIAGMAAAEN